MAKKAVAELEPQTGDTALIKLGRIAWNGRLGAAANARRQLPRLAAEFFSLVAAALEGEPDAERLHRVRLAAKHIRYTLELFRPCYGPALEERIGRLRELQQVLGEINDCAVTRRLVTNDSGPSPQRQKAEQFLAERLRQKVIELRQKWAAGMGDAREQRRWIQYLAKNAREPRPPEAAKAKTRHA